MRKDNVELSEFMKSYLKQLLSNIPDAQAYEMPHGFNSPGWILGHYIMEGIEVLEKHQLDYEVENRWWELFHNTGKGIVGETNLPPLSQLIPVFDDVYQKLNALYLELAQEKLEGPCTSKMLGKVLTTHHSWFVHHLTTHIGIHVGNIVYWKKIMGIEVNGYG